MNKTFLALSHPVRRLILERLAVADLNVGEVAKGLHDSPAQITKHVRVLEDAGLLVRRRQGREHRLHFEPAPLDEVIGWVERHRAFWLLRFDALDTYLATQEKTDE